MLQFQPRYRCQVPHLQPQSLRELAWKISTFGPDHFFWTYTPPAPASESVILRWKRMGDSLRAARTAWAFVGWIFIAQKWDSPAFGYWMVALKFGPSIWPCQIINATQLSVQWLSSTSYSFNSVIFRTVGLPLDLRGAKCSGNPKWTLNYKRWELNHQESGDSIQKLWWMLRGNSNTEFMKFDVQRFSKPGW